MRGVVYCLSPGSGGPPFPDPGSQPGPENKVEPENEVGPGNKDGPDNKVGPPINTAFWY